MFVSVAVIVAVVGEIFYGEAVRALDALGAWWGS